MEKEIKVRYCNVPVYLYFIYLELHFQKSDFTNTFILVPDKNLIDGRHEVIKLYSYYQNIYLKKNKVYISYFHIRGLRCQYSEK